MSLLKKVTVLLEDEADSRSSLTRNLGSTLQEPQMCVAVRPTKVYVYDIFGLMTMDSKITDYLKTRDGLIIIINSPTNNIIKRINEIISIKSIPILIFDKSNTITQMEKDNLKISRSPRCYARSLRSH
jgi:signal recognition particle receptor subunit beta